MVEQSLVSNLRHRSLCGVDRVGGFGFGVFVATDQEITVGLEGQ